MNKSVKYITLAFALSLASPAFAQGCIPNGKGCAWHCQKTKKDPGCCSGSWVGVAGLNWCRGRLTKQSPNGQGTIYNIPGFN